MIYSEITKCRADGNLMLENVISLGVQHLTGVFPKTKEEIVESGPLEVVFSQNSCLLQLKHNYTPEKMYGMNYGYRSSLNGSMVKHLQDKALYLQKFANLKDGDTVLDIGSNDSTFLRAYTLNVDKIGIDPTGIKFKKYYPDDVTLVSDFFTKEAYNNATKEKSKIITSISMFYDLQDISKFVSDVVECLHDEGVWHLEQSYMPAMIRMNAYDTICHEHLEYYSLLAIEKIMTIHDLEIAEVTTNSVNGGSFAVSVVKKGNKTVKRDRSVFEWMLNMEYRNNFHTREPYDAFDYDIYLHQRSLFDLITKLKNDGKTIYGYGASTKGNVLLQACRFTSDHITAIAEVNEDKFGCYTPGTHIPILSEKEVMARRPDYMLVLPWHFRDGILRRETEYLAKGGKFIFPCPHIEVV